MVSEREKEKKDGELRILELENEVANASTDKINFEAKINSLEEQILVEKEQVFVTKLIIVCIVLHSSWLFDFNSKPGQKLSIRTQVKVVI